MKNKFKKINCLYIFILSMLCIVTFSYSAEWTVMVYMDGDNNLEGAGISDVNEMEVIGSDENINIVVLFDRIPGYDSSNGDWADTRRGLITKDTNTSVISSNLVSVGEKNMGDKATLTDFVNWSLATYPANHYLLVLWDHGNGWFKRSMLLKKQTKDLENIILNSGIKNLSQQDELEKSAVNYEKAFKSVCVDESNGNDALSIKEIREALTATGRKIDILAYDACLMGMMEIAYDLKDNALIQVASEQTIPVDGFPYDMFLYDLKNQPLLTAPQLSSSIVTNYKNYYMNTQTLSAIDLTKIENLNTKLDSFAQLVISLNNQWMSLEEAKNITPIYDEDTYHDLKNFLINVANTTAEQSLKTSANDAVAAFDETVIANHSQSSLGGTGLSIYIIGMGGVVSSNYNPTNLNFTAANHWDEMLKLWATYTAPDDYFEQNDTSDKATPVAIGYYTNLKCFDDDWYDIEINTPGEYLFSVNHVYDKGDIDIELYKKDPITKSITYLTEGATASDTEAILYDVKAPGIYCLYVFSYDGKKTSYSLLVKENKLPSSLIQEFPEIKWEDISTTGTPIVMGDDTFSAVNIGFNFPYFAESYNIINVSSNGYMLFSPIGGDLYLNQVLTVPEPPNGIISPFWADLIPDKNYGVYFAVIGDKNSEEQKFVVQWNNVSHYVWGGTALGTITFQAILYKSGIIDFVYKDVFFSNDDSYNYGGEATVGLDNAEGMEGFNYSYNNPKLKNDFTIRYKYEKYDPMTLWIIY